MKLRIQEVIDDFASEYYIKKLQRKNITFEKYINNTKYDSFKLQLENAADQRRCSESELIFDSMTEDQKNTIGSLFKSVEENNELEDRKFRETYDKLDRLILNSEEIQEYRKNLQPHVNTEQNEKIVNKLARLLYNRLSNEEKQDLTQKKIRIYILNLGFLKFSRSSYRESCDFIIKYKPLFKNEREVLDSILERYVEEKLSESPIEKTSECAFELKQEVREIYRDVLE